MKTSTQRVLDFHLEAVWNSLINNMQFDVRSRPVRRENMIRSECHALVTRNNNGVQLRLFGTWEFYSVTDCKSKIIFFTKPILMQCETFHTRLKSYNFINTLKIMNSRVITTSFFTFINHLRLWQLHYCVHKIPALVPIINQMNPIQPKNYFLKMHLNTIPPSSACYGASKSPFYA